MKHKSLLLLMLGVGAMMLTSCEQDVINDIADTDGKEHQLVVTGTVNSNTASRAVGTSWEAGDEIGISATNYDNVKYVTTKGDGNFTTDTPYYFTSSSSQSFYAYYPYTTDVTDGIIPINIIPEANEDAQKPNDYLWAKGASSYSYTTITLAFTHLMAKVIINVEASTEDGFDADDIFAENGTFKTSEAFITAYKQGEFNIKTGEVKTINSSSTFQLIDQVDDKENHVRSYTILLLPQAAVTFYQKFDAGLSTAQTYKTVLNGSKLSSGYTYIYNLKLKKTSMDIKSESVINDWKISSENNYSINTSF